MRADRLQRLRAEPAGKHVETVLGPLVVRRQRLIDDRSDRRDRVDKTERFIARRSLGDMTRPANDVRNPEAPFPHVVLAAAERAAWLEARFNGLRLFVHLL